MKRLLVGLMAVSLCTACDGIATAPSRSPGEATVAPSSRLGLRYPVVTVDPVSLVLASPGLTCCTKAQEPIVKATAYDSAQRDVTRQIQTWIWVWPTLPDGTPIAGANDRTRAPGGVFISGPTMQIEAITAGSGSFIIKAVVAPGDTIFGSLPVTVLP